MYIYQIIKENTEETIKNEQSRETGNIWHIQRIKIKQKHNTISAGHTDTQAQRCVFKTSIFSMGKAERF